MTPVAIALADALLEHHREFCVSHEYRPPIVDRCVTTYAALCRNAGVPGMEVGVGPFLQEVAEWCADQGYPPINALAVNGTSRMPGESSDLAPNCSIVNWPTQAAAAIVFENYPETA